MTSGSAGYQTIERSVSPPSPTTQVWRWSAIGKRSSVQTWP